GTVMGTVGYMAPEQVRGEDADHRADIFAFGVILYEMLSGRRPFKGASAVEVMNAILKEEPPELGETNAKISPQLERIVRRCLEKREQQRFQSASDLAFDLEMLSGQSGLSSTAPVAVGSRIRERFVWMAVSAVLLLAALLLAFAYFRRAPREI